MKKTLYALTCTCILASSAMADFARVEMGAGLWMQEAKGGASYTDNSADGRYSSDKKDNTQSYVWALVKHAIPLLPNLRLEYANIKDSGIASGRFKNFDVGGASTSLSYNMKQYDIIPYYNILDNTSWVTIDLGLDFKIIDGSYTAAPTTGFAGYRDNITFVVPLAYVRGRVEIPSTDVGVETDVKYITVGSSTVYDVRAKIDYTFDISPVIQPAIEVGYRIQKIDLDNSRIDAKINIEFSGFYAGAMLRF